MSMYGLVFGKNPAADAILATLGLKRDEVGRFRDAFVANGEIAVYTRNGGGNREHWDEEQEEGDACSCTGCVITYRLPKHPLYLRDADDDFDQTYATIYFRFPDEYAEDLRNLDSGEPFDPSARWTAFLKALEPPEGT